MRMRLPPGVALPAVPAALAPRAPSGRRRRAAHRTLQPGLSAPTATPRSSRSPSAAQRLQARTIRRRSGSRRRSRLSDSRSAGRRTAMSDRAIELVRRTTRAAAAGGWRRRRTGWRRPTSETTGRPSERSGARHGKSHHASAAKLPGFGEEVGELCFAPFRWIVSLQHTDHREQQPTDLHHGDRARDVDPILPAPRVWIDTLDRPGIGGPGSAFGRMLDAADAPGDELATGLFDTVGKVGKQRGARPVRVSPKPASVPFPGDPDRDACAAGRRGERADRLE